MYISYDYKNLTCSAKVGNVLEEYLNFSGKYRVVNADGTLGTEVIKVRNAAFRTFQLISYCTILLPILALVGKAVLSASLIKKDVSASKVSLPEGPVSVAHGSQKVTGNAPSVPESEEMRRIVDHISDTRFTPELHVDESKIAELRSSLESLLLKYPERKDLQQLKCVLEAMKYFCMEKQHLNVFAIENYIKLVQEGKIPYVEGVTGEIFKTSTTLEAGWESTRLGFSSKDSVLRLRDSYFERVASNFYTFDSADDKAGPNTFQFVFANRRAGGKCFGPGFVQEEQMAQTVIGYLAAVVEAIAKGKTLLTRLVSRDGLEDRDAALAGLGTPEPFAMKSLYKVIGFNFSDFYGRQGLANLHARTSKWQVRNPSPINVVSLAAPDLRRIEGKETVTDPNSMVVLQDLFETLYKGCKLAQELCPSDNEDACQIFSGPIGCGVFKNNKLAVMLLHWLVEYKINQEGGRKIEINMYGYTEREKATPGVIAIKVIDRLFRSGKSDLTYKDFLEEMVDVLNTYPTDL